jgi:hypothetical protein
MPFSGFFHGVHPILRASYIIPPPSTMSHQIITILLNNCIQKNYDAIRIAKSDDTCYTISYAYENQNACMMPIFTQHTTISSYDHVCEYVDTLIDMVVTDTRPASSIEIQANMFPCIMLSQKTLDQKKPLIQKILRSLFVAMKPAA